MRELIAILIGVAIAVGFAVYGYYEYKVFRASDNLPLGSGGGGKKRRPAKNP
jgi:hypothetical protein